MMCSANAPRRDAARAWVSCSGSHDTREVAAMSIVDVISRRGFSRGLLAGGMAALASRAPAQTKGPKTRVPIVMTAGVSGLVLHEMALAQGYFDEFSIEPEVLTVSDGTKSTAALINGSSDICMWSGFNQLLPAIEKGARPPGTGGR